MVISISVIINIIVVVIIRYFINFELYELSLHVDALTSNSVYGLAVFVNDVSRLYF